MILRPSSTRRLVNHCMVLSWNITAHESIVVLLVESGALVHTVGILKQRGVAESLLFLRTHAILLLRW